MKIQTAMAVGIALVLTANTRAETVWVSQLAASPTYSQLAIGTANSLGQNGTSGNPFGSVQAAYAYLYSTPGNHTIRLRADGGGTYGGDDIGQNENANGNGVIRMVNNNIFPNASPTWTTVKLVSDSTRVTMRMSYPTEEAPYGITSPGVGTDTYPAAYEKEVSNPGTTAVPRLTQNRGATIRGLWNAGNSMALPGMIVEDLDIVLGGGHVLVGTTSSLAGTKQQFTFNNVNVTLEREMYAAPITGNPIWGKSALFTSHMPQADLNQSYLSFNNSSINLIHNDNYTIDYTDDPEGARVARLPSAWDSDFFVGQTWAGVKLPNNFVTGNASSTLNYWNGTEYVEWADAPPGSIWQSNRNPNSLRAYQLGGTGVNNFFDLASFVPPPGFSWLGGIGGTGAWAATGGTNWNDGPWNAAKTGEFAGSPGTVTVDVGGVAANNGLEFAVGGYTLSGDLVTLGGANAAANAITTLAGTTTINAPLAGSTGLTKAGVGVLVLGGANTFSGGATVSAGTLSVGADENLGDASGGITLGGGTLEMTSGFTLGSGRTITAVASSTSTLAVTTGTVSYGGAFTGSGNLDKAGAGRLVVSNASSDYTGLFTVSAGTLEVTGQNAFANATLSQTGGTLLLAPVGGGDVTIPGLDGSGGIITVGEDVTAVVGGAGNSIYGGQITGQGGLRKEGAGDLRLNGTNDFSGALQIAVGRLILGFGGTLSATELIEIGSGAIFDVVTDRYGFVLGNGQQLGGEGTVLGYLEFGSGSLLAFNPNAPLLVGSGMISFASGFGIANIVGLDLRTEFGTYTLLDEIEEGFISFSDLANVGFENAVDIGGGKLAYFQEGSLQLVVVPEPSTALLGGLGLAIASWSVCRRHRRVLQ